MVSDVRMPPVRERETADCHSAIPGEKETERIRRPDWMRGKTERMDPEARMEEPAWLESEADGIWEALPEKLRDAMPELPETASEERTA